LLDKYVFSFCNTAVEDIKQISHKLYDMCINCRTFEAGGYALYFAVKYNFKLSEAKWEDIINSKDCILMLLAYKYFEFIKDKISCRKLKDYAAGVL